VADSMVPLYLRVDEDGRVFAEFEGEIKADGVILPAGAIAVPDDRSRVKWVEESSGAVVAEIFSVRTAPGRSALLIETAAETDESSIVLRAGSGLEVDLSDDPSPPGGSPRARADFEALGKFARVIDSDGRSSFARQVGPASAWRENRGIATVPTNGLATANLVINHGIANADLATLNVQATVRDSATRGVRAHTYTASQFTLTVSGYAGGAMGSNTDVAWRALGVEQ
jgi:hypothetical protein